MIPNLVCFQTAPLLSLLCIFGLATADVHAQGNTPTRHYESGLARLLSINGVAEEVELTTEQADSLDGLWDETREELRSMQSDFQQAFANSDREPTKEQLDALNQSVRKVLAAELARMKRTLLDGQVVRLQELQIQLLGPKALLVSSVVSELEITKQQQREIKRLLQKADQKSNQEIAEFRRDPNAYVKKLQAKKSRGSKSAQPDSDKPLSAEEKKQALKELIRKHQTELEEATDEILDSKQRKKFRKMRGEEFDFLEGKPRK